MFYGGYSYMTFPTSEQMRDGSFVMVQGFQVLMTVSALTQSVKGGVIIYKLSPPNPQWLERPFCFKVFSCGERGACLALLVISCESRELRTYYQFGEL